MGAEEKEKFTKAIFKGGENLVQTSVFDVQERITRGKLHDRTIEKHVVFLEDFYDQVCLQGKHKLLIRGIRKKHGVGGSLFMIMTKFGIIINTGGYGRAKNTVWTGPKPDEQMAEMLLAGTNRYHLECKLKKKNSMDPKVIKLQNDMNDHNKNEVKIQDQEDPVLTSKKFAVSFIWKKDDSTEHTNVPVSAFSEDEAVGKYFKDQIDNYQGYTVTSIKAIEVK